jgi:hypothetical protein
VLGVILLTLLATGVLMVRAQAYSKSVARGWSLVAGEKTVTRDPRPVASDQNPNDGDEPLIAENLSEPGELSGSERTLGLAQIKPLIDRASQRSQIPAELIYAVIKHESGFRPQAVSLAGACGLMQLMPATARRFSVRNVFDPAENIEAGVRYLRFLLDLFSGNLELALAAYNVGEETVMKYGYRMPPFSDTQQFVRSVLSLYEATKGAAQTDAVEQHQEGGASLTGNALSQNGSAFPISSKNRAPAQTAPTAPDRANF